MSTANAKIERVAFVVLASVLMLFGCRRTHRAQGVSLEDAAKEYIKIAAELGQRDQDSLDYAYGPEALQIRDSGSQPAMREIEAASDRLETKLEQQRGSQGAAEMRREFLVQQTKALASRAALLLGAAESFDEETRQSFGVVVPAGVDARQIAHVQRQLNALLPGGGSLAARYARYDAAFLVTPAKVPTVLQAAMQACREATLAHVPLPKGESVTLAYVHNKPWSAYSWYRGAYHSEIDINMDYGLTVDRIVNLACHEAYPGHHTYNSLREQELVQRQGWIEYSVQPTYSPQSMISEAMANEAAAVALPAEQRLALERDVLFPLAGLERREAARYLQVEQLADALHSVEPQVAREYLDGRMEFERASDALERNALMTHPEVLLQYMNEYRSYVTTYTYGRDQMAALLQPQQGDELTRWGRYLAWMQEPVRLSERGLEWRQPLAAVASGGG
ncbi:MAG: hypothetical protein KGK08_08495 [Acidobacteriota bacterium]|nr:hypothetical protein [Acidobacteriota bacterium]